VSSGHGWWSESDGAAQTLRAQDSITKADTLVPVAFAHLLHAASHANGGGQVAVAFQSSQSGVRVGETHATLDANNGSRRHNGIAYAAAVRRLTPRECERLQGFPDDYTLIPWRGKPAAECPDGPRYKALGNSMAVPVVRWIGRRIAMVDAILKGGA
jgi:DNA (cytosine-5)-methyltransferase 1